MSPGLFGLFWAMNQGKYVFAQISSFLPQRIFDRIVAIIKAIIKSDILVAGTS